MRRFILTCILALMSLGALASAAAADLAKAEAAMAAGRVDEAIVMLEAYRPVTRAESLRRLWALGIGLGKQGRHDAAIVPLAQLVALEPREPEFRLELAAALMRAGQTERARYQLELVKASGLTPASQAKVQRVIDTLAKPKIVQGYLSFAFVPQSNASKRTSLQSVALNGFAFNLAPQSRAQAGKGIELGFGAAVVPELTETLRGRIGVDVFGRKFDVAGLDESLLRGNLALLHYGAGGRSARAEVFVSRRWLGRSVYSDTRGVQLGYGAALGEAMRANLNGGIERTEYTGAGYGVTLRQAQVEVLRAVSPQLVLRGKARLEQRSSSNAQAAGRAQGVTLGGRYSFHGGLRVGLDLSYDRDRFAGVHPLFGVRRQDLLVAAEVELTHQDWSYRGFAPVLTIGLERQRSNVPINSYRNVSASIGITRSF